MFSKRGMIPALFACLVAAAAPGLARAQINNSMPVVVASPADGKLTLIYEQLFFGATSITKRLYAVQSSDGGATWTAPNSLPLGPPAGHQPTIITSFQSGPSLMLLPGGGYLNFHHFGGSAPSDIWREVSTDGINWPQATLVDLGWPGTGGSGTGSGFPSVVRDGASSLTMLYVRLVGDGADPAGLYLSRSTDLGLNWSPLRTLVAGDVTMTARVMLAHRNSDGRYLAAYLTNPGSGEYKVVVKATDDVLDWSAPPALEIPGNNGPPALVTMPDGAFVLLYSTKLGDQHDIFLRRSLDGISWGDELRVTNSPDNNDSTPFGVAGTSPDRIDLYWSRSPDLNGFGAGIVHAETMVLLLDPVFVDGFDD